MAKASKKRIGAGARGKRAGSGAMTEMRKELIPDNAVLSNRDKAGRAKSRGMDGKDIQTQQLQDHAGNRLED